MTILSDRNTGRAEALAERINTLAREHGQAQVARKTEFSSNNVSRYVNGTRAPLEFGTALVEDLGVNPAWLLTGQGAPYLSEVSQGTVQMAGDLLELVKAMAAVSHMRLGSLAGKHHLAVLRELNSALERFEELRGKLDKHSEQIFRELLSQVDRAFETKDMTRAEDILKAAQQVGRLCQNETLHTHLHACQAITHYAAGRNEQGLEHQRRAFQSVMLERGRFDEWVQMNGHNYAKMLMRDWRMAEARRVVLAIEALSLAPAITLPVVRATLDVELGNIGGALETMSSVIPSMGEPYKGDHLMPQYARAQVLAGLLSTTEAVQIGANTPNKWAVLLETAAALEDRAGIESLLAAGVNSRNGALHADRPQAVRARAVLDAMSGKLTQIEHGAGESGHVAGLIAGAQLSRLAGKATIARKLAREAGEALGALDAELTPPIEIRITQARNVLALLTPSDKEATCRKLRELAARNVDQWLSAGYHALRGLGLPQTPQ